MREIIYIPIIHSEVDMGSVSEELKREYIKRYGEERWLEHTRTIEGLWERIRKEILSLPLDYNKVKLYQDGLPKCGRELEIVKKLASEGSENHKLLQDLVERGSKLIGTEDPQLLLEEYKRMKKRGLKALASSKASGSGVEIKEGGFQGTTDPKLPTYDEITLRRDRYIARRIDETLREGEIGLLFMGAIHRTAEMLPPDIKVRYLLPLINTISKY